MAVWFYGLRLEGRWRLRLTSPRCDAASAAAADKGKASIAWPITVQFERERALGSGATGLMTSTVMKLVPPGAAGANR